MSIIERAMQRGAAAPDKANAPSEVDASPGAAPSAIEETAPLNEGMQQTKPLGASGLAPTIGDAESSTLMEPDTQALNLPLMRRQGLLIPDDGRSALAEEFRILKRPVLGNAFGPSGQRIGRRNVVMVTSAVPGEGKTYTAINLAMSIAMELQRTVLLIDADVVQPSVAARLGLTLGPGLIDLLEHAQSDLSTHLVKTSIPNLTVLGAGRRHGRSTELLASAAMARLVDDLASRYPDRLVLFDSPPMLATSESSVLARHMGQIVLTVEAGVTPRSAVSRAVKMLDGCDIVIPVLNKASRMPGMNYSLGYYLDGKYGKQ
ncbi:MAG: XrtA-associated tyrosine autokinase [Immundisolibacter sp.]|uniref:XrtA-associated tyrosine autokinase n=1 Tax=Immundisolibacter sp. TaxID=1934948 RepID=UPI003D118EC1